MTSPLEALRARVNIVGCLEAARATLITSGRCRSRMEHVARRDPAHRRGKGVTLLEALLPRDRSDNAATLSAWHARFVLLRVTGGTDLAAWSAHPYRTRRDVLQALIQAIRLQRGEVPRSRRGGWRVSAGGKPVHPAGPTHRESSPPRSP